MIAEDQGMVLGALAALLEIEGDIAKRDCLLRYKRGGRLFAVASIGRDKENLEAELKMERALA